MKITKITLAEVQKAIPEHCEGMDREQAKKRIEYLYSDYSGQNPDFNQNLEQALNEKFGVLEPAPPVTSEPELAPQGQVTVDQNSPGLTPRKPKYPKELEKLVESGVATFEDDYWLVPRCQKCGQFKSACCGRVLQVTAVRQDDKTLTKFGRQAVGLDPITPPKTPKSEEQILEQKMAQMKTEPWWSQFRGAGELEGDGTVKMYIENFLPSGITLLCGLMKEGKSFLAMAVAKALTTGEPLFGRRGFEVPEIVPTLYLAGESKDDGLKVRCKKFGITEDKTKFICRTITQGPMFGLDSPEIESCVKWMRPAVVLETLIRFNNAKDEDDAAESSKLANAIFHLLSLGARAVIVIHHSRKDIDRANPTKEQAVRGSGDILAMADAVWVLMRDNNLYKNETGPNEIDVFGWGRDFSPRPMRLGLTKKAPKDLPEGTVTFGPGIVSYIDTTGNFGWVDRQARLRDQQAERQDLVQLVEGLIAETPSIGRKDLAEKTGVSEWEIRSVLKRLGYRRKKGGKEGAGDWEKPEVAVVH